MHISRPSVRKISWLINHPSFKQKPIQTLLRVLRWEIIRIIGKPISFVYDKSLTILLYPNDGVARLVYYFDYHEPAEFAFLDRYLEPDMLCVDIGANIGTYALFMAKRVSKVIAFEPQPETSRRLRGSVSGNHFSNIKVEQKAVTDQSKRLALVPVGNDSAKTFTQPISSDDKTQLAIDAISLDEYFALCSPPRLDFLKLDVEGAELNVLCGARKTLAKFKPTLQIEMSQEAQSRSGKSSSDIEGFFRSSGYEFDSINSRTNSLKAGTSWNTFAVHRENIHELFRRGIVTE